MQSLSIKIHVKFLQYLLNVQKIFNNSTTPERKQQLE